MSIHLLDRSPYHRRTLHLGGGAALVRSTLDTTPVAEANQALRDAGAVKTGDPARLGPDGSEVAYTFQVAQEDWSVFKVLHQPLYQDLHSKDALVRERAAARIARLHPEWVVARPDPNRFFRGHAQQDT